MPPRFSRARRYGKRALRFYRAVRAAGEWRKLGKEEHQYFGFVGDILGKSQAEMQFLSNGKKPDEFRGILHSQLLRSNPRNFRERLEKISLRAKSRGVNITPLFEMLGEELQAIQQNRPDLEPQIKQLLQHTGKVHEKFAEAFPRSGERLPQQQAAEEMVRFPRYAMTGQQKFRARKRA